MTPTRILLLATTIAVSSQTILSADEFRLADGRTLYGSATERGDQWIVETRAGEVRFDKTEIVRHRDDAALRQELTTMRLRGPGVARVELEVARLAHRYDLDEDMWAAAQRVAEADDLSPATERRLDEFLATLKDELLPRRLLRRNEDRQVRELVFRIRQGRTPIQVRAIRAILGASDAGEETLQKLARKSTTDERRTVALEALWDRARRAEQVAKSRVEASNGDAPTEAETPTAEERATALRRFTYRSSLVDADPRVRREPMAWAREAGRDHEVVEYLGAALLHAHPSVRIRAAESFGALRTPAAAKALIASAPAAIAGSGTASPRAYAAFINQRSYVRDFEVEIASGAFIADPTVDVLQSGAVLDVKVAGSYAIRYQVTQAFRRSLAAIGGSDPGNDPRTWGDWWAGIQAARTAAQSDR